MWSSNERTCIAAGIAPGAIYLMPSQLVPGGWRDVHKNSLGHIRVRLRASDPSGSPFVTVLDPALLRGAAMKLPRRQFLHLAGACEWGGWGRLSDDGPGQNNPDLSEGPWGGGLPTLQAVHDRVPQARLRADHRSDHEMHGGRRQTNRHAAYAGSRLKLNDEREGLV